MWIESFTGGSEGTESGHFRVHNHLRRKRASGGANSNIMISMLLIVGVSGTVLSAQGAS